METFGEQVVRLVSEGYAVNVGRHYTRLSGYFACVYLEDVEPECECCENVNPGDWDTSGHGPTLHKALDNGEMVAKGHEQARSIVGFGK